MVIPGKKPFEQGSSPAKHLSGECPVFRRRSHDQKSLDLQLRPAAAFLQETVEIVFPNARPSRKTGQVKLHQNILARFPLFRQTGQNRKDRRPVDRVHGKNRPVILTEGSSLKSSDKMPEGKASGLKEFHPPRQKFPAIFRQVVDSGFKQGHGFFVGSSFCDPDNPDFMGIAV